MARRTISYERSRLYGEVWTEPVRTVAKRYGVSGVALAKVCHELKVPVPGRGYWAEKEAGTAAPRTPLPVIAPTAPTTITRVRVVPDAGLLVEPDVIVRVEEERSSDKIIVPGELGSPHPLVARAEALLKKVPASSRFLHVLEKPCLDVVVGRDQLDRALRIVDTLVKALETRGLPVEVIAKDGSNSGSTTYATRVVVNDESIEWGLAEMSRQEMGPPPPPPKEYTGAMRTSWLKYKQPEPIRVPNGLLALLIHGEQFRSLGTRSIWQDGKKQRVENCLNSFIAELFTTAAALKRLREERERHRREWDERVRLQKEAAQRQADEANRAKELNDRLVRWRLARDAREYVAELVSTAAAEGVEIEADSPLGSSLAWISAYADRIDPVTLLRTELRVLPRPTSP